MCNRRPARLLTRMRRALALATIVLAALAIAPLQAAENNDAARLFLPVNIIDGSDDRGSLLVLGPKLGLSADEIARIRSVSGYVGCLAPSPSVGSGALFLTAGQVLTAAHIFFEPSGRLREKCFFRTQATPPVMSDILLDAGNAKFGALRPKPGSNDDYAIVRLAAPIAGAEPFPVETAVPVKAGDTLVVVTAHPAGMRTAVDNGIPVVQSCKVRRAPHSTGRTSFYRSDCDASGASSGGMNLARVGGRLVYRGVTISTGPWQDPALDGAPYDEARGSVTTALGADAGILKAGKALAAGE